MNLKSIDALLEDLQMIKQKIESCDAKLATAQGKEVRKYQDARAYLEAVRDRITTSLDLMSGRAFTVQYGEGVHIFKPEPSLAKLLKVAEEAGARVSKVTKKDEGHPVQGRFD
jgi:hypothetical protein